MGRLRFRASQRIFNSIQHALLTLNEVRRMMVYIEQASLMHRRAIVLAFLPAALEVLAYSFSKSSSSETCFQFHIWCQFQLSSSFSSSFKFLFSIIVLVYRRYEYV